MGQKYWKTRSSVQHWKTKYLSLTTRECLIRALILILDLGLDIFLAATA